MDYLAGTSTNTMSHTFDVVDDLSQLTIRLGHAVLEGNGVSLISYANNELDGSQIDKSSWRWTQTQGPNVTLSPGACKINSVDWPTFRELSN